MAALQLVREHQLSLRTPVRVLIDKDYYTNPWASSHPIRLVHLLALSAGFAELSRAEFDDNMPRPLLQALSRFADQRRVWWRPGLQHSYSNVAPGLTAAVIEQVSGRRFEKYLHKAVMEPLGMHHASLFPVDNLPGGFQADGHTPIPYWHMTFTGFGALNASLTEMSRFATALVNDGLVDDAQAIPSETVNALFRPMGTLGAAHGLEVGYGPGIYGRVRNGQLIWRHGGDADGYRAGYGLLPEHGRGYLLVFNTDNPELLRRMEHMIEEALTHDLPARTLIPQAGAALISFAGDYAPSSSRFRPQSLARQRATASVAAAGDTLIFAHGADRTILLPAGQGRFFRPGDPAVTVVFARDTDGRLYLQGELGNFVQLKPPAVSASQSPPP